MANSGDWTEAALARVQGRDDALNELKPILANLMACLSSALLVLHDTAARSGGHEHVERLDERFGHLALSWGQFCLRQRWYELVPSFIQTETSTNEANAEEAGQ